MTHAPSGEALRLDENTKQHPLAAPATAPNTFQQGDVLLMARG
jgi:hypothetical protein